MCILAAIKKYNLWGGKMEELEEIKASFKEDSFNGHWLKGYQIKWLIEQTEQIERYENSIKEIFELVKTHNEELAYDCEKILEFQIAYCLHS